MTNTAETEETRWLPATPDMIKFMARFAGGVEWGSVSERPDFEHVSDFADSLRMTREHFNLSDAPLELHGVYLKGTETVICHTGTSPNSAMTAQIIAGLLHSATRVMDEFSSLLAENARLKEAAQPFVDFAANVDADGWTSTIHREQISTWFGPSDFRNLRAALHGDPQ